MPIQHLILILAAVILCAALTVWLISLGGPGLMAVALPALLIASLAIRALHR